MKIKNKLLITVGALITFIFVIVGINFQTYQTLDNDSALINYSGRLRATSYRMSFLANVIVHEDQDAAVKAELEETMEAFETILAGIKNGNAELGLEKITHTPSIERLSHIEEIWTSKYKIVFDQVLNGDSVELSMPTHIEINEYVSEINKMVEGYSKYSSGKVMNAKVMNSVLSLIALLIGLLSLYFLNKGIKKPIASLTEDLKALSEGSGDLTKRIETSTKDEIAEMTHYFNDFVEDIHEIVMSIASVSAVLSKDMNAISTTTEELTKSTEMIAISAMDVAEGSSVQNDQLDALNKLSETLKNDIISVSDKASQTLSASEASQRSVEKGNAQVEAQSKELNEFAISIQEASKTVEDLNQSSGEIKAIVELIQNISHQTNLLALNASIEAARAGEAGKGFAVVADEIRKLAEETALSATQINDIVGGINENTYNVKESMDGLVGKTKLQESGMELLKNELIEILNRTTMTLEESKGIMAISTKVSGDFNSITDSVKSIQNVAANNSNNTQDVASAVEQQTAAFEEVSANISSMDEMANKLNDIVGVFKI